MNLVSAVLIVVVVIFAYRANVNVELARSYLNEDIEIKRYPLIWLFSSKSVAAEGQKYRKSAISYQVLTLITAGILFSL